MKILFVYPRFSRHAEAHPELRQWVPMNEYLGSPSLGIAAIAAVTPDDIVLEFRDDRLTPADTPTDADVVAFSFFTPAARRAIELASYFRELGKKTIAGGIFPTMMPELCEQHFDAVVVGEGEPVWAQVLADVRSRSLQRRYKAPNTQSLETIPLPRVDLYLEKEAGHFQPDDYPVQLSRGCMLHCSACILPVSMGRSLRTFPVEHALAQIEQLERFGKLASLTEDTSFFPASGAQRAFGELLDAIAERGRDIGVSYVGISMPLVLAQTPTFFARLRRAGVRMFYLVGGFDPITRGAYTGRDPKNRQRAIDAFTRCMDEGIEPYTSFLVGNDGDDEGTFDRMLEVADRVRLAKAEFAIRTPYPGTPDFDALLAGGRLLHQDWSRYNDANVVFQPAQMSPERLLEGYLELWRGFYGSRAALSTLDHRERTIQF